MELINLIGDVAAVFVVYCSMPVFVFLLVLTLGLKERDEKLKVREIVSNVFKKIV